MTYILVQDTGVHALSNVCHVDVERISKRKPGEMVCVHKLSFLTGFTPNTFFLHFLVLKKLF